MQKCFHCGIEHSNPKFCSRSCAVKSTNVSSPKRKIKAKCKKCDLPVYKSQRLFCKFHRDEYFQTKNRDIGSYRIKDCLKDLHVSSKHAHIRGLARTQHQHLLTQPCAKCGYDYHVELCHLRAVSDFPDDALISEVNSVDNVTQLCRNCHWELDHPKVVETEKRFCKECGKQLMTKQKVFCSKYCTGINVIRKNRKKYDREDSNL